GVRRLARGPVFEEAFKFAFIALALQGQSALYRAAAVGLGVGVAEAAVNTFVAFDRMTADLAAEFPEFSDGWIAAGIALAVAAKVLLATAGHGAVVYCALRLTGSRLLSAFAVAVVLHFVFNLLFAG